MTNRDNGYKEVIRDMANNKLTAEFVFRAAQSYGISLKKNDDFPSKVIVGKDTRASGHMIEAALCAGFCSVGVNVVTLGVLPAPAISYLVKKYKCSGGVEISAARLGADYNGLTFFDSLGTEIGAQDFENIRHLEIADESLPSNSGMGIISRSHTALRDYVDHVKSTAVSDLSGMKIAIDASFGAGYESCKLIFKELGADVEMLHNIPNGKNINENCGIDHPEIISAYTVEHKCDLGIAFDGSCHDFIAFSKDGTQIGSDEIETIIGSSDLPELHSCVTKALRLACIINDKQGK